MCEILVIKWPRPHAFGEILPWALQLETLGIAGFGWGVAWPTDDGHVEVYKDLGSLAKDETGQRELDEMHTDRLLVHLRRPSRLSTIQDADAQPFRAPNGSFAFSHNGVLERFEEIRPRFADHLHGAADSEVAFQLLSRELLSRMSPGPALKELHHELGGDANFVYFPATGDPWIYGGHRTNPMWTFHVGEAHVAATALHSTDDSVFQLIFPNARVRTIVEKTAVSL